MKLSGNPALAYQQGKQAGRKEGVHDGFMAFAIGSIVAARNVNIDRGDFATDEQFGEWFKAYEAEINRLLEVECKGDLEHAPEMLVYFADKHRRELGLEGLISEMNKSR